jgi:D-alanine-D-alanine ligase
MASMEVPMRVALVFGGRSGEHEVSVVSARSVAGALASVVDEVVPMAIDHRGRWAEADTAARVLADSGDRPDAVVPFEGVHPLDPRLLRESFDVVLPILHGPFGEDGAIQGLFEMLDLPYVGCDVTASAVCMDKLHTKAVLERAGFATAPWVEVRAAVWSDDSESLRQAILELGLPVFVKPARLGSSVGISRVAEPAELDAAMAQALSHGTRVLVEKGLDVREIEVAVLGDEAPRASVPGEVVPGHDFYSYEDKYLDDACQLLAPAPLADDMVERVRTMAVEVFCALGCQGMARVDLFLDRATDRLWVNEVNTIPGFTSISMYPKLWSLTGLAYPDLLMELIELARHRHQRLGR